jgi:hypothetical protein
VKIRNYVIALAIAGMLGGMFGSSKALASAAPAPVVVAGSTATTGVWLTGGFVGAVAVICIYDIYLKVTGVKNWDGSMKVAPHAPRSH